MRCLCAAFFQQLAKLLKSSVSGGNTSEYLNLRHTFMKMYLHPTSALNSGGIAAPLYVIYHELILTNKEYMSCVTAVQPQWLLEYGSVFYGVTKAIEKRLLNETGVEVLNKTEFQKRLIEDKAKLKERELRSNLRRKPITSTKAPAKTGSSHNRGCSEFLFHYYSRYGQNNNRGIQALCNCPPCVRTQMERCALNITSL